MDLLSEIVGELRLESVSYCRLELTAPWALRFPAGGRGIHIITRGSCWLEIDGARAPVAVASGDLVVMPSGRGHVLRDALEPRKTSSIEDLVRGAYPGRAIEHGGAGLPTTIVCGQFRFGTLGHPALEALPPVLHLRGDERAGPWIQAHTQCIAAEVSAPAEGAAIVTARLSDVLLVQALRAYLRDVPADERGWLRGLADPQIGRALARMHRNPELDWSVLTLAQEAGMSRAAFSARFSEQMGASPGKYLADWRMYRAKLLLRSGAVSVSEVAASVGYRSEAAFSYAFKKVVGSSPSAYRHSYRETGRRGGQGEQPRSSG
ncbi:AraC family transcriptional regulator [Sorangium sp. So ce1128]